jgi:iron complex outermembrane recepter protein
MAGRHFTSFGLRERRCVARATIAAAMGLVLAASARAQTAAAPAAIDESGLETIIVTARKRDESVAEVPTSITVFTAESLQAFNIQSFNDYATKAPNISFSYGSGPTGIADARAVAIRGITGQNLFGTAGATGFYIDDTPVPGSVDPRVLDIQDVEVLKGPQGTLFGASSLGGNVRLITKKPDLNKTDFGYMAQVGSTSGGGSIDGGGNFIGNMVLVPDSVALRVVLFANHDAGYLTRTYPDPASAATTNPFLSTPRQSVGDQGAQTTYGGSLSLRYKVSDALELRLRVMFQDSNDHGFPATFASLPDFTPDYTLNRAFDVQPKASDSWSLPSLDIKYRGTGWDLVSSTSFFYRHTQDVEDSTYGTEQILNSANSPPGHDFNYGVSGLPAQPYIWDGEHWHNQLTEEVRVAFDERQGLSGILGVFYSRTRARFWIPPTYANGLVAATVTNAVVGPWPNDEIWEQNNPGTQEDKSVFGELYYKFSGAWTLTIGLRQYWLKQDTDFTANGFMNFGATASSPTSNQESGLNPKFGLSYQLTDEAMVYGSASKGFRAGGAQANFPACQLPGLPIDDITHVRSDTLWSYELGTKVQIPHPGLLLSAAAFHINWANPQTQVALPCGFYLQVNANSAKIDGTEFELNGRLAPGWQLRLGGGYEKTDITDPGILETPGIGVMPGSRIFGVPAWNASVGLVYTQSLSPNMEGFVSADLAYIGDSVALLNGGSSLTLLNGGIGNQPTRPSYSLVNVRCGVDWGNDELSLNVHNLFNAKPNLGDIGYVGYAQYDAAGAIIPQVATLQPLTAMLRYQHSF